jgi:desulfoferrodoxin (superoxide reductase-like protein)
MKKFMFLLLAVVAASTFAKADPPQKVNLSYLEGKLTVDASHKVLNPNTHYIDQIVVKVNGQEVQKVKLDKQTSKSSQVSTLDLPNLKTGDKVEVAVRCNEFGEKKGKLVIN